MKHSSIFRSPGTAWLRRGLRVGLATSAQVPVGVLLSQVFPSIMAAYPLVLLPLLLSGPLAVGGRSVVRSLLSAGIAGIVAGVVAACSLALGSQVLGEFLWNLTMAASTPPMPTLPRVEVLPSSVMSWAQQDILFILPLLSVLLGALVLLAQRWTHAFDSAVERLLPHSLGDRLATAFGGLTALTILVGWVGFSVLEEMHLQVHRTQLQADWQHHLSGTSATLSRHWQAVASGQDATALANESRGHLSHLEMAEAHPSLTVSRSTLRETLQRYEESLLAAKAAQETYLAQAGEPGAANVLVAALNAIEALRVQVDADTVQLLQTDDVSHHQRLITVMLVVAVAGMLGLGLGQHTAAAVARPIQQLGEHFRRVARGDFSDTLPVRGADEMSGLVAAVNHMTSDLDRLYAAEKAERARAEAIAQHEREVADAREFWTNTVIHDLKNPLSLVSGYVELLESGRMGALTDEQRAGLGEIGRASADLLRLVADINDSFRLGSGTVLLETQPTQVLPLLRGAAEESSHLGHEASVEVPAALPPVTADPRLIRRVLGNLVGNALKHAGRNAHVELRAWAPDDVPEEVWLAVDDDGPGISLAERERIFERFVQSDGAGPGSGLGLAFCKLVVERHGGRIWAEVSPSGGARIVFSLPLARSADTTDGYMPHEPLEATRSKSYDSAHAA